MRILFAVMTILFLVGCANITSFNPDDLENVVGIQIQPANLPLRHLDSKCPAFVQPYIGNYWTEPGEGTATWKFYWNLPDGWHCFYISSEEATTLGLQLLAYEVFLNGDEATVPKDLWIVAKEAE